MATAQSNKYNNGDRVDIVNGKYKGMKATYVHKYGQVMCSVAIDGGVHRNIWLSSIKPHKHDNKPKVMVKTDKCESKTEPASARKEDIRKLQKSIEDMKLQLDLMQATLKSLLLEEED